MNKGDLVSPSGKGLTYINLFLVTVTITPCKGVLVWVAHFKIICSST